MALDCDAAKIPLAEYAKQFGLTKLGSSASHPRTKRKLSEMNCAFVTSGQRPLGWHRVSASFNVKGA
jgi:hypothetical protein